MGANLAYLEKPDTRKFTSEGSNKPAFNYATSGMQGWRHSMEDAHIVCPQFDPSNGSSLFAVFDGHGGMEVAKFCERNFGPALLANQHYKNRNYAKALEEVFLTLDQMIMSP